MPDYPVYEKDGKSQIAATPQREVELQYAGWRKQQDAPAPKSEDTGSAGAAASAPPKTPKTPK